MKQWKKMDEKRFGDFHYDGGFGVVKENNENYCIGRFNKNYRLNGLGVHRLSKDHTIFAQYNNGYATYPAVHIFSNGIVSITLGDLVDGSMTCLRLDPVTSSFAYISIKNSAVSPKKISYNGKEHTLSFLEYEGNELKSSKTINRNFIPERPIFGQFTLKTPPIADFNKFEFRGDKDYFIAENSSNKNDPGIGMIVWGEDDICVGEWLDNVREGWQIMENSDKEPIIYYEKAGDYNGLYIARIGKTIYIASKYGSGPDKNNNSYVFTYTDGVLTYSDVDDHYFLDRCGDGICIPDFDTIQFKKYVNDCEEDAVINETVYRDDRAPQESASTPLKGVKVNIKINANANDDDIEDDSGDAEEEYEDEEEEEIFTKENNNNNVAQNVDKNDPEYKMMHLIGQEEAKKEFVRIRAYLEKNKDDCGSIQKNMFFSGGAGVGKTTVAKLITEILYKYGAIDNKCFREASAKTLFSNYDFSSKGLIEELYKRNRGGVILINDARYFGRPNNSGIREALNEITKYMESDPKTVFILADTKFNLNDLYLNNTDVLHDKIRFKIDFQDFTKSEMREIITIQAAERGYSFKKEALDLFLEVAFLSKSYGTEINASAIISMLEEIIIAQNVRTSSNLKDKDIIVADVETYIKENDIAFIDPRTGGQSDARKKLDELIGLEKIKETVDDLIAYFSMNRGKKVDCHMAFFGNPGTGKTEVARILGKLLRQEGILPTSKFIEVTRRDLVAEYVGQSAVRTRDVIDKAMGGVLYIDEAYSLAYGGEKDFGREVIAELLKAMEDRRGEFVVILAGYTKEMLNLFNINPGFYSRIKYTLEFPDYNDDELNQIAHLFVKRDGYTMSEDNYKIIVSLVSRERNYANFANVRTLREYLSKIQIKQASRIRKMGLGDESDTKELILDDIIGVFGKEAVEEAMHGHAGRKIEKLDPARLRELYKSYPKKPFEEYRNLIGEVVLAIRIRSKTGGGESTGFIITNDGYVATCAHCVEGAEEIDLRRRIFHNGKQIDIHYAADIVSIDTKNDVAVLKIRTERDDEEFDFVALAEPDEILPPLSRIFEMGYPFGVSRFDTMTVNEGKVASYQKGKNGNPDQINLDIDAHGGNSGSLIVDGETSRVIGTLTGASLSPHGEIVEQINFCRPISYIWAMLERDIKK